MVLRAHSFRSSGNALFLVLIAVALFAALSFAITQSSRSGGGTIDKEKLILDAGRVADYAGSLQKSIMHLRFAGCDGDQISFENDVVAGYVNPLAPADGSCHVFEAAGGGLAFLKPPELAGTGADYEFTIDTDPTEISLLMPVPTEAFCTEINRGLDINVIMDIDAFVASDPELFSACILWPASDPSPAAPYLYINYLLAED